eukprot:5812530-Amphidinium_carterae.1
MVSAGSHASLSQCLAKHEAHNKEDGRVQKNNPSRNPFVHFCWNGFSRRAAAPLLSLHPPRQPYPAVMLEPPKD